VPAFLDAPRWKALTVHGDGRQTAISRASIRSSVIHRRWARVASRPVTSPSARAPTSWLLVGLIEEVLGEPSRFG
jgi:hypothetical protein